MLSEEDRLALEDRYFGDSELLNRIDETERDLIQAYLGEQLPPDERSAFESHFLRSGAARRKVEEARTVAEYFRRSGVRRSALTISLAASLLLMFAVAGYLALNLQSARVELARKPQFERTTVARLETHSIFPGRQRSAGGASAEIQHDGREPLLRLKLETKLEGCASGQCRARVMLGGPQSMLVLPVLHDAGGLRVEIPTSYLPARADCLLEISDGDLKVESFQFSIKKISPETTAP